LARNEADEQNVDLRKTVLELQQDFQELKKQSAIMMTENAALKQSAILMTENAALKKKESEAQTQNLKLQLELDTFRGTIKTCRIDNERLQRQIQTTKSSAKPQAMNY
jgi:regulator of replication initiation timing